MVVADQHQILWRLVLPDLGRSQDFDEILLLGAARGDCDLFNAAQSFFDEEAGIGTAVAALADCLLANSDQLAFGEALLDDLCLEVRIVGGWDEIKQAA